MTIQSLGIRNDLLPAGRVAVGIAYNTYVEQFLADFPDGVDSVEIPFEHLRHDPSVLRIAATKPLILHCASLSIAGSVRPSAQTIDEIESWIERTRTPWLGEHLAFITADATFAREADEYAPGEPFNIGYTVSPAYCEETLGQVLAASTQAIERFQVPLLLENSPVYFESPGSTMTQAEFFHEIRRLSAAFVLLDLTHLYITAKKTGEDPFSLLHAMPLDRVVEIHVSGVDEGDGMSWDDHATPAPATVHELLEQAVRSTPLLRAVTLEYNWSSRFPRKALLREIERVKTALGRR